MGVSILGENKEELARLRKSTYSYSGFIDALTRTEALAVLTGAKTDPLLEMFIEIARARNGVDFNDDATRESAPYLVQAGIVTEERLAELIG